MDSTVADSGDYELGQTVRHFRKKAQETAIIFELLKLELQPGSHRVSETSGITGKVKVYGQKMFAQITPPIQNYTINNFQSVIIFKLK